MLHLETQEGDQGEVEASASLATAEEICVAAAVQWLYYQTWMTFSL